MVPFENSSNGSVVYTLDCFIDRDGDFPDVFAFDEVYMDVQHCLVGYPAPKTNAESRVLLSPTSSGQATPTSTNPTPKQPRSQPLTDLRHITDIYSHPQAFGQCQMFLSAYLKAANHHEVTSTSKAAEMVKEEGICSAAAISSVLAAEVHGLSLLAKNIQDREDNTTRFLTLRKGLSFELPTGHEDSTTLDWKSLLVFDVIHESHGALAKALLVFEKQHLNLTHFNSRPSRVRPWHYIFLVECAYNGTATAIRQQIQAALADLKLVTEGCKCLGFWQDKTTGKK